MNHDNLTLKAVIDELLYQGRLSEDEVDEFIEMTIIRVAELEHERVSK